MRYASINELPEAFSSPLVRVLEAKCKGAYAVPKLDRLRATRILRSRIMIADPDPIRRALNMQQRRPRSELILLKVRIGGHRILKPPLNVLTMISVAPANRHVQT